MRKEVLILIFLSLFSRISIAQFNWEHTDGPPGAILAHLYTNDEFAFIPKSDFMFRSADGVHWQKLESACSIYMAVHKDTIVSPLYDENLKQLKLKISTDNGDTWLIKDLPAEIINYGSIALCRHGIYWLQYTNRSLFKSTDLGNTWDTIPQPLPYGYNLAVFEERLYAFSATKMWRTDEHGDNWEEINLPNAMFQYQYMDDFVVKDSNMVITTEDYIFHSHDHGLTWNQIEIYSSNSYDKITLAGNSIYAYMFNNILRTDDFGFHWDTLASGSNLHSPVVLGGLRDIFLTTTYNQGVFRWDDLSQTLIESNDGLSKGYIYDLSYGADKIWTACGNGVFAYDVPTETWGPRMNFPYPTFEFENVSANESGWVVASEAYETFFFLSRDRGDTWDTIHTGYYIDNLQFVGNTLFITDDYRKYRSVDQGLHWEPINSLIYGDDFVPFKGSDYVSGFDNLIYTQDDGLTFQSIPCPFNIHELTSFEDQLFALTEDSLNLLDLFISNDGLQWIYAGNGFPDVNAFDYFDYQNSFFFRDADHYYFFLSHEDVYWSPVDEISWSPIPSSMIGDHWLVHNDILYLGDEGMYKTGILNPYITDVKDLIEANSSGFSINPNPVSEMIHITFDPTTNAPGKLNLYSADGVLQYATVITQGEKEINISLQNYPASLYYVVFVSQDRVESHPCLKL